MNGLLYFAAAVVIVFGSAWCGRAVARALRQPAVIGEIVAGLVAGPALLVTGGPVARELLAPEVLSALAAVGHAGLVLYLVRVTWHLRAESRNIAVWSIGWIVAGAYAVPLAAGAALAAVLLALGVAAPGGAHSAAFVLMVAVALAVTAVPALARILDDRPAGPAGPLALAVAICIDVLSWPLLALAVGLAGGGAGVPGTITVTGAGVAAAVLLRRILGRPLDVLCRRSLAGAALVVGVAAIGAAELTAAWGMTHILGAVLVGLALPARQGPSWSHMIHGIGRTGGWLLPAFFVTTGLSVFAGGAQPQVWWLVAVVTAVAFTAKLTGGYVGSRLAGHGRRVALRLGVLLNTRGLTELIVLQAGYEAGILTGPVYTAFVVMALACTAATAPLLAMIERGDPDASSRPAVRSPLKRVNT